MGRLVLWLLIVFNSYPSMTFIQFISIYSIYSLILPRSDQRDAETIVISSYYISRRQRRCSLVSKYYPQPQLLINFVSIINAWRDSFTRWSYSALRGSHLNAHIPLSCLARLTLQECTKCNFILSLLYISILLAWLHTSYVLLLFEMARLK